MKVFVINLDGAGERRCFMAKQLAELGINYEFFPAVDGRKISDKELATVSDARWFRRYVGRDMTRSDLGCALSHVYLYKKMVEEGLESALVLEDDAWITPALKEIVVALEKDIQGLPVDVVLLSECIVSSKNTWRKGLYLMSPVVDALFTHAYVITNYGAQKLIHSLFPIRHPADAWNWLIKHHLIRIEAIHPVLATQNQTVDFVADRVSFKKYSAAWIRRKLWRAFWRLFDRVVPVRWHKQF